MKAPLAVLVSLSIVLLCVNTLGQARGGGRGSTGGAAGPSLGVPGTAGTGAIDTSSVSPFLSGKVVLDDGTPLTEPAAIETTCRGIRHTVAYTDSHGVFSFQFGDPAMAADANLNDAGNASASWQQNRQQPVAWKECQLEAQFPGFTSDVIELANRGDILADTDVGRITLHRLGQVEGSSISVTSALAPPAAKKALDKGREAEKKGQWDQAQQSLEKAVHIYPKYASAWYELGRVQVQKNDLVSAKQSFEQSVNADPQFVNPYDGLAQLALQAKQWPEVLAATDKLLQLNPVNFPTAYFQNGVANYYLKNWDAAEKIVRQGTKVDDAHRVPKLQYLLGMILLQKHDYAGAADFLKQYLQLTRQPAEIAEAQKELLEIEKLSGKSPPAEEKR